MKGTLSGILAGAMLALCSGSDASLPDDPAPPAPPPLTGHRAFFILFSPMLDSPDWPSKYEQYRGGIVVMNPFNTSKSTVQKVRDDLNVRVVMYWDTEDIQIKAEVPALSLSLSLALALSRSRSLSTLSLSPDSPMLPGAVYRC